MAANQLKPPLPSKAYLENCRWIHDHHAELLKTHGYGWVAAHDGRVLAGAGGLGEVTDLAEQLAPAADIGYVYLDDATMIF